LGKGEDRPINTEEDRLAVLAALESVSLVVLFNEDTAREVALAARPDIYVKGGDYVVENTPEGQAVLAYGGRVYAIPFQFQRSTSALLKKVRQS
jgi:rfaE bifunctional protein nucleotidyltransferase chain/domain